MELFIDEDHFISPHFIVPTPYDRVPTHLKVADIELLGFTSRDGTIFAKGNSLNPLEFARWGSLAVRQTEAFGHSHISDDESAMKLLMRMDGDQPGDGCGHDQPGDARDAHVATTTRGADSQHLHTAESRARHRSDGGTDERGADPCGNRKASPATPASSPRGADTGGRTTCSP